MATSDSLLARAASLVPMLRTHAAAAEKARRVPQESLDALSAAGIFTMTAPKAFGGVEADFQTQCDVLAEIARGCPSTSWVATIYSAMSWLVGVFPDETQQEIFADRDPRIAGVFSPTGTAVETDGGFVVNGRWPFNTGCHGATWTVLNVLVGELPTCMLAKSADLTILDDWYATGMSATGSNTVVAENVFVPSHRAMPLPDMLEAKYPARHNSDNPYFNYPMAPVLTVNAGGTPIGTARGAWDAFVERLPGRGITYTTYTNKAATFRRSRTMPSCTRRPASSCAAESSAVCLPTRCCTDQLPTSNSQLPTTPNAQAPIESGSELGIGIGSGW